MSLAQGQTYTKIDGRWLILARIGWLAFFGAAVLALVVAIPLRWNELNRPTQVVLAHLNELGWPAANYALFSLLGELIFSGIFLLVGLVIFLRRPDDRMALLASLMLVAFGVGNQTITPTISALLSYPFGEFIFACAGFMAWATFTQFPFLFPSGRYEPGWTRLPALVWFILCIPWNFMVGSPFDPTTWPEVWFLPLGTFLYGSFVVSQVYRYRRISTPLQRQQTKWVVFALVLVVVDYLLVSVLVSAFDDFEALLYLNPLLGDPPTSQTFALLFFLRILFRVGFLFLPFAFAFSILRYRLWDIDLIIRRTLVYGGLTAVLALVFFGGVTLFQSLFQVSTGQQSEISIVLSTLAIAALFNPLRRRIQEGIDRRFYRKKYNLEQVVERFAASARGETDVERLSSDLVEIVEQAIQPVSMGLWLKPQKDQPNAKGKTSIP